MVIWRDVTVLLRMAELLQCWREAEIAFDIAAALHRIKSEVDIYLVNEVAEVTRQIWLASKLLRDLYDLYPFYIERGHYLLDYLSVILPCLHRTLQDIRYHIGNYPEHSFGRIWIDLDADLQRQSDVSLRGRFTLYNDFLVQLIQLLSRSEATFPLIGPFLTVSADHQCTMLQGRICCGRGFYG